MRLCSKCGKRAGALAGKLERIASAIEIGTNAKLLTKSMREIATALRNSAPQETRGDWPPPFEPMKLQARKSDGGEWTDIFPAQLEAMVRNGCDVRAIELPQETRGDEPVAWQYRTMFDRESIRGDEWCDWHDAGKRYFDKVNADIAAGATRVQTRALYAASQQSPRLEREGIALEIWHRFADSSTEEWKDETHKAEYLFCADAILALLLPDTSSTEKK